MESVWSSRFHPGNQGLTPAQGNLPKKPLNVPNITTSRKAYSKC